MRNAVDSTYNFLGLYVTSLFSVGRLDFLWNFEDGSVANTQNSLMPTPPPKLPRSTSGDHLVLHSLDLHVAAVAEVVMEVALQVVADQAVGRGWAEWTILEDQSARAVNDF